MNAEEVIPDSWFGTQIVISALAAVTLPLWVLCLTLERTAGGFGG